MSTLDRKKITAKFLTKRLKFQPAAFNTYELRIKCEGCTALIVSVDIISEGISYMTSLRNERDGAHSILKHEYEDQISKLVYALQGK